VLTPAGERGGPPPNPSTLETFAYVDQKREQVEDDIEKEREKAEEFLGQKNVFAGGGVKTIFP